MDNRAEKIQEIILECLFKDGEDTSKAVCVDGIVQKLGFHPERLEKHRPDVKELLTGLHESFYKNIGGGMTFMNLCVDASDDLWGSQRDAESLVLLGLALNMVQYCMPRSLWRSLPGGVPYVVISLDGFAKP